MANKWRTTVEDAYWVFVRYSINPSDALTETLVRKITGIDKSVLYTLITAQKAITTVTDPVVDNQTYSGTWTVKTLDPNPDESGNTAGSADIVQVLSKGSYDYATPDNISLVRNRAYPLEQNENSWMYYERFKEETTQKWSNLTYAAVNGAVYDGIRQIRTLTDFNAAVIAEADTFSWPAYVSGKDYYARKYLYDIIYIDYIDPTLDIGALPAGVQVGDYCILETPEYRTWHDQLEWWPGSMAVGKWETIESPVIRECWYERNEDGTYNLYRTLETTGDTAVMRTRLLQYAGMTLVSGLPILDDTTITIKGFNKATETVYKDARFRIGGDTYRVLADAMAVADTVTVSITPSVTQNTEDLVDASPEQVQVDFAAL